MMAQLCCLCLCLYKRSQIYSTCDLWLIEAEAEAVITSSGVVYGGLALAAPAMQVISVAQGLNLNLYAGYSRGPLRNHDSLVSCAWPEQSLVHIHDLLWLYSAGSD